jgi:hypothetical protein
MIISSFVCNQNSKSFDFRLFRYSHAAAQGGNLDALKNLFEKEDQKQWLNSGDDDSWMPLHYASWYDEKKKRDRR